MFFTAISDIALDALSILTLTGSYIGYAGSLGSIGAKVGMKGGRPVLLWLSETSLGMQGSLILGSIIVLASSFAVLLLPEPMFKRPEMSIPIMLKKSYSNLYQIVCNRNTFLFAAILLLWKMGFSSAVTSPVDRMYRGYTKKDVFATMWIDAVPSVLFPILCAKFTSRPNPIKMLRQWGIPFFIFGTVLEYLTYFLVPYTKAKKDASFEESCIGNGCESWVFPFRSTLNVISIPFQAPAMQLLFAHISRVSPYFVQGRLQRCLEPYQTLGVKLPTCL